MICRGLKFHTGMDHCTCDSQYVLFQLRKLRTAYIPYFHMRIQVENKIVDFSFEVFCTMNQLKSRNALLEIELSNFIKVHLAILYDLVIFAGGFLTQLCCHARWKMQHPDIIKHITAFCQHHCTTHPSALIFEQSHWRQIESKVGNF